MESEAISLELRRLSGEEFDRKLAKHFVFDGKVAPEGRFPWQAALVHTHASGTDAPLKCGAVLLSDEWALTSGHCVFDLELDELKRDYRLLMGTNSLSPPETGSMDERQILEMHLAPGLDLKSSPVRKDLALLRFQVPSEAGRIVPIGLPASSEEEAPGLTSLVSEVEVSGWGQTCSTCPISPSLRFGKMKFVALTDCRKGLLAQKVFSDHVCSSPQGGEDFGSFCVKDSGGGLVYRQGSDVMLVGVASMCPCGTSALCVSARISEPSIRQWLSKVAKV